MTIDDLHGRLFATTSEAAAILGNDPRTVRRMIAGGNIPARKNGSRHIIPVAWLADYAGTVTTISTTNGPDVDDLADRVAARVAEQVIARFALLFAPLTRIT